MPQYIISATGGNFTDATSWQDSVVPPSATASDIIGLSFSGPLYFNNLGNRTIGDLDLTDYENILGFTGSSTVLNCQGGTFSFGSGMTFSGNVGTGTNNNQRFILTPLNTRNMEVRTNGIKITRSRFHIDGNFTSKVKIVDELVFESDGTDTTFITHSNGGGTVNDFVVSSATAGVPAEIKLDPRDTTRGIKWETSRFMQNKGYEANIRIVGTGSGSVDLDFNNQPNLPEGIPIGSTLYIDNNVYLGDNSLVLMNDSKVVYTSGDWIGTKRIICSGGNGTNQTSQTKNFTLSIPGLTMGCIDMRHDYTSTTQINTDLRLNILDNLETRSLQLTDTRGSGYSNVESVVRSFTIAGTNSTINLGQIFQPSMMNLAINTFIAYYGNQYLYFDGGYTYSVQRFVHAGNMFNEFGDEANFSIFTFHNPTYSVIAATGTGNATIKLLRDENTVSGCDIRDIDFIDNPLYAFGSTFSNTTGVLTSYPTGGTGSGGGEVSFTFLS